MASQNITLKINDIDIKQICCDKVKIGKDTVPLLKYGKDKKVLCIQGPWIKMKQYGLPPGEELSNGNKNEYYIDEDSRLSIRFPVHPDCCINLNNENNPDETNREEISGSNTVYQGMDAHFKTPEFMAAADIDPDDKEKYVPIYRKPAKSKKNTNNDKEKYYSIKTKLDTDGYNTEVKKIKTIFEVFDKDTNQYKIVNNTNNKYITLPEIENVLKFNSDVCPIFQLVKIWTQSTGAWGVTLKLKRLRIKNPVYAERFDAIFLEDDNNKPAVLPPKPPQIANKKIVQVDSDEESDDDKESDDEPVKVTPNKTKVIDSDSDSDNEPIKTKKVTTVVDSDSDEDVKPKKTVKKPTKTKKANA